MYVKRIENGQEATFECSWVTVQEGKVKERSCIEVMTDNDTFDSFLCDKSNVELYVMNDVGKTIESYRWPKNDN